MRNKNEEKELTYNHNLLLKIMKNFKYEPFITISNLEYYIDKYPLDMTAYIYYSQILIDINNFESAEKVIDYMDEMFPTVKDDRAVFNKFRLLCLSEKYEEAKEFYDEYKYDLLNVDPKIDLFETIYETKNDNELKRSLFNRYVVNQIIDYQDDSFIDHIKKHLADYNKDFEQPNPALFNADFPLEKVLNEIRTLIPNDKSTNFSFYNNFYVFKYDNVGRLNNKPVDYIRVVVINGTDEIITMYPMQHGDYLPYIDLNYLNTIYQKPKVKTLSRVDKFYKKYPNLRDKNN